MPSLSGEKSSDFLGTERFEIRDHLGTGGMGAVYRAYDREKKIDVALKVLLRLRPKAIMRFKREFRSLADVSHENLVSLYELFCVDERWFFTMELINGIPFRDYALGASPRRFVQIAEQRTLSEHSRNGNVDSVSQLSMFSPELVAAPVQPIARLGSSSRVVSDFARLRRSLAQLAEGVCALHRSGHLHCDIKLSNIMVDEDERAVLLDFGLITTMRAYRRPEAMGAGTPMYMSPEQVLCKDLSEASDWYSVGVLLYRLLTGRWPHSPGWIRDYQLSEDFAAPPRASSLRADIPEDLDALCSDLLRKDPDHRPTGTDILRRLGNTRASTRRARIDRHAAFIGRDRHLAKLERALADVDDGAGQIVYVRGDAGMGKTTLVQYFLDELQYDPRAVVLQGRCYQRETVPYKALDSLIDSLCHYLDTRPVKEVSGFLPDDMAALARVFPVLAQVAKRVGSDASKDLPSDPQELRRRAAAALRQLFTRIGARHRLVLFVDDLQWGDIDSAPFLDSLMLPPDTPRLLLVATYRGKEADKSSLLRSLFAADRWLGNAAPMRTVDVGSLSGDESTALAYTLLLAAGVEARAAGAISRESAGDPLFIHELARYAAAAPDADRGSLSLADVIRARVANLVDNERSLIEILALAGRPIPVSIACQAAEIESSEQATMLHRLRTARLIHVLGGSESGEHIEIYHDRIREVVTAGLPAQVQKGYYRRLASAVEESERPDPKSLAAYYLGAGDRAAAARYALIAARRAAEALSFARAAMLYQQALELGDHERGARRQILIEQAQMQQAAGQPGEASDSFLAAAELSSGLVALDLRRRAAGEKLRSGRIAEGMTAIEPLLREVGLEVPKSRMRAFAQILYWRARLRLRGLRFEPRQSADIPPRKLLRVTTSYDLYSGLVNADPVRASAITARALVEALSAGDRESAVIHGTCEVIIISGLGQQRWAQKMATFLESIGDSSRTLDRANLLFIKGMLLVFRGHYAEGYARNREAIAELRNAPERIDQYSPMWLRDLIAQYATLALLIQLDFAEMDRVAPGHITAAEQCGNGQCVVVLRSIAMPVLSLCRGDLDRAYRETEAVIADCPGDDFQLPHFLALLGGVLADLYGEDGISALRRCQQVQSKLASSLLLQLQLVRIMWRFFRGLAAARACLEGAGNSDALLRRVAGDARALDREGMAMTHGLARLLRGSLAIARGHHDTANWLLGDAARAFDNCALTNWAAVTRWVLGKRIGGRKGESLAQAAETALAGHRIVDLGRMSRLLIAWT